ncbi:nucleotidyl transferase AbiEii/AbiGii toxin family protein [Piscinibacter sp. HJYY11]|uniref:nucleotidyl transferase AbiEii/AbiGii toxin family protein n=1 Tax=Piscinibacter sp. HJYY11 TaxID=2801333 RepID=UPI00191E32D1|nr:nucleotidyl transferase AbiEii/AbiGii toxin family protein [Piscinibacter sp. HJYY11]MBL0727357.1 nucleotidyl transferase AbiEii/AbiGii toxin family protein [Piscinibacter sp. HJYY11]
MFERAHHRRIATVLEALDAPFLLAHRCLFGGGTAIALRYGEYRESVDIDFVVSDLAGYRELRQRLTGTQGLQAIVRDGASLQPVREVRADQYGLRTLLKVDEVEIKFEIVLEGRIELDPPGPDDLVGGVAALTRVDMAATKLLANSDRWADDSVFSRDLIDLAMMQPKGKLMKQALAKAQAAYGDSVERDLGKAVDHLLGREGRLERCMTVMQVSVPRALLWQRIKALRPARRGGA